MRCAIFELLICEKEMSSGCIFDNFKLESSVYWDSSQQKTLNNHETFPPK